MSSIANLVRFLWYSSIGVRILQGRVIRALPPRLLLKLAIASRYLLEEDLTLIHLLCHPNRIAIDVGAHFGHYTHYMLRHSRLVYAFEPMPTYARTLAQVFTKRVIVEPVALSDETGECTLRIPTANPALATVEPANLLSKAPTEGGLEKFGVPMRRLDDYKLADIGFIKIDVEGHELAVLKGARSTIERDRPALLIEIEDRHRPNTIAETTVFLQNFGYEGFFRRHGRLYPLSMFVPEIHQNPDNVSAYGKRGEYIVNFVFVNPSDRANIATAIVEG